MCVRRACVCVERGGGQLWVWKKAGAGTTGCSPLAEHGFHRWVNFWGWLGQRPPPHSHPFTTHTNMNTNVQNFWRATCTLHTEQHLFLRKRNFTQNSPAALIHCAHCEQCTGCARWGGESCTTHRTHSLDCLAKNWVQSSHTPLSRLQGTRRPFKAKHLRLYCIQSYLPSHSSYGLWFWSF